MALDKDLSSIQEARDLAQKAYEAWKSWSHASQAEVDRVCAAMAEAGYQAAERLGRLAQEETGFGVAAHKKIKNEPFAKEAPGGFGDLAVKAFGEPKKTTRMKQGWRGIPRRPLCRSCP